MQSVKIPHIMGSISGRLTHSSMLAVHGLPVSRWSSCTAISMLPTSNSFKLKDKPAQEEYIFKLIDTSSTQEEYFSKSIRSNRIYNPIKYYIVQSHTNSLYRISLFTCQHINDLDQIISNNCKVLVLQG